MLSCNTTLLEANQCIVDCADASIASGCQSWQTAPLDNEVVRNVDVTGDPNVVVIFRAYVGSLVGALVIVKPTTIGFYLFAIY